MLRILKDVIHVPLMPEEMTDHTDRQCERLSVSVVPNFL